MSHTKGPWIITPDGEANFVGIATEKGWLMRIQQNGELSVEEQIANARLIAAARELLEALQYVVKWHRENDSGEGELFGRDYVTSAIQAIHKATEGPTS